MYALILLIGMLKFSCAYENLAFRKPTWQSSTHSIDISGPEKALDGLKSDLSYNGQQCSVSTDEETNATWWVNLTDIVRIHNIMIYYRTENGPWGQSNPFTSRFMGFYLYISNTTNMEDGFLCFHDTIYTTATIPAVANISCPIHGQYVIYYNERPAKNSYTTGHSVYAYTELCEVEVYGCSNPMKYGGNCSKPCPKNCKEYCHIESGYCLQCKPGYSGTYCEQENMAYKRQTWQSSIYYSYGDSAKAVDGLKTDLSFAGRQCSVSNNGYQDATWWVNLTEIRSIRTIVIYYRTDNDNWDKNNGYTARFMGFYLYVSNSTNRQDGHLCFHDTNYTRATIPAVAYVSCLVHGQYVIYFNERPIKNDNRTEYSANAFIELCEVEVYGCSSPNHYGSDCSKSCPINCKDYCNIESGSCKHCKAGFRGSYCEQVCLDGSFGENCDNLCNDTCKTCNRTDGVCDNDCYPGWMGIFCEEECSDGYFGLNCLYKCNDTCKGCNKTNGICDEGCYPGLKGSYCHEECDGGFHGEGCSLPCGHCKERNQCHSKNGTCLNGCAKGYVGLFCNKTCSDGYFGESCVKKCNNECKGCNRTNGICENGCNMGWQGDFCNEACTNGYFGSNCLHKCNETCRGCNGTNGVCENGCLHGWKGLYCHEECNGGFFGNNCSMICGKCLNSEQCQPNNGTCMNGCEAGYEGGFCNKTCKDGTFGHNCHDKCNDTCYGCNRTNGKCETGCHPGWKGDYCHEECIDGFFGKNCSETCGHCKRIKDCQPINGMCLNGCIAGYEGHACNKTCSDGYFGENCVLKCSDACKGCNRGNGICEKGCRPGWEGKLCSEQCLKNLYGEGCNVSCGQCLNGNQCHHINGSCQSSCEPGYSGDKCDEVCMYGYFGANCGQECSLYCKKTRDCHHVSGICRGGCKRGWQGNDCMEDMEDEQIKGKMEDLTKQFYSAFGVCCFLFFLIGLFTLYKIVKRFKRINCRKSNFSSTSSYPGKGAKTTPESMVEYENNLKDEYQELGDVCSHSNYDMLK